jgi:hypothetical protein
MMSGLRDSSSGGRLIFDAVFGLIELSMNRETYSFPVERGS